MFQPPPAKEKIERLRDQWPNYSCYSPHLQKRRLRGKVKGGLIFHASAFNCKRGD